MREIEKRKNTLKIQIFSSKFELPRQFESSEVLFFEKKPADRNHAIVPKYGLLEPV